MATFTIITKASPRDYVLRFLVIIIALPVTRLVRIDVIEDEKLCTEVMGRVQVAFNSDWTTNTVPRSRHARDGNSRSFPDRLIPQLTFKLEGFQVYLLPPTCFDSTIRS